MVGVMESRFEIRSSRPMLANRLIRFAEKIPPVCKTATIDSTGICHLDRYSDFLITHKQIATHASSMQDKGR